MSLMATCESPLGRGGAQRRGGFFVTDTHPEAFGFCPSQEGIGYPSLVILNDHPPRELQRALAPRWRTGPSAPRVGSASPQGAETRRTDVRHYKPLVVRYASPLFCSSINIQKLRRAQHGLAESRQRLPLSRRLDRRLIFLTLQMSQPTFGECIDFTRGQLDLLPGGNA